MVLVWRECACLLLILAKRPKDQRPKEQVLMWTGKKATECQSAILIEEDLHFHPIFSWLQPWPREGIGKPQRNPTDLGFCWPLGRAMAPAKQWLAVWFKQQTNKPFHSASLSSGQMEGTSKGLTFFALGVGVHIRTLGRCWLSVIQRTQGRM